MDGAMRALADPTRREILRRVREDELAAGEIARHFPAMSRPAVSQHLRVLADAGLVVIRPSGNLRLYRWRPEGLGDVTVFLAGDVVRSALRRSRRRQNERSGRPVNGRSSARPGRPRDRPAWTTAPWST